MDRRVVITGLGLITPLGIGVEETWAALCAGRSGISTITRFDASAHSCRIAGEVKGFRPEDFLSVKEARRLELFIAFAVAAARMALDDSGLVIDDANEGRVGVITGCGLGGLYVLEETVHKVVGNGPQRISPFFIPMLIGNMAPGMISIKLGAKGPNASIATACAAGTHAVGDAYILIRTGRADAMVTGGVEAPITPTSLGGFCAMKALSTRNDDPPGACRPFDRDRDGFVMGEGCGILILESREHALDRGARIYAEIVGYGASGDGFHMTAPPPDGGGAIRSMRAALEDAGIPPDAVDHINAHGTSTYFNDLYETRAIKAVFGRRARQIPISATKSMTGHLLGGAGGVETVFTVLSVVTGLLPPTINLDHPGEECTLDYVPNVARKKPVSYAMKNSFGFGGTNATLVIRHHPR